MNEVTILEAKKDKIISIQYKNNIFKIGDKISLYFQVDKGIFISHTIESFQNSEGGNKHFPNAIFPKYTIITGEGCLSPEDAKHVDYTTEAYKLNNTDCLSIVDVFSIFGEKKHKKLLALVKDKLENE